MKGKQNGNNKRNKGWKGSRSGSQSRQQKYKTDKRDDSPTSRKGDYTFGDKLDGLNDFSWYNKYPDLLQAAASVPYPYRTGMPLPLGSIDIGTPTAPNIVDAKPYGIPGIMAIKFYPTLGKSTNVTDPASITCKELYARVRKSFSGSLNADAPDFLIYLMALDSVFSYIGSLKRVYRILNAFTPMNYSLPDRLLFALGIDYSQISSFRAHKTTLFGMINELVYMTKNLTCPAVMDIFNRHYWMNDNVYADSPSQNSQLYVFKQAGYFKFQLLNTPDEVPAGGLKMTNFSWAGMNLDDVFNFGRDLINALASWDDAYTISGYLARAFEGVPSFSVDLLTGDEMLTLQYQEEVLTQIENIMGLPQGMSSSYTLNLDVTQNPKTNIVISNPTITIPTTGNTAWGGGLYALNSFINLRTDTPTVADTVIATRLKCAFDILSGGTTVQVHCGTELVVDLLIVSSDRTAGVYQMDTNTRMPADALLETFDWHPLRMVTFGTTPNIEVSMMWDVHNITAITREQLDQIHRICIYSEFNAFNA